VSPGCIHCYAETVAARFSKPGQAYDGLTDKNGRWNGQIMVVEKHMLDPIRWRRPRKIFVNSMSDLFHENVPEEAIDRIFGVMAFAERHTFQVLTKRPDRMRAYLAAGEDVLMERWGLAACQVTDSPCTSQYVEDRDWPLPNVWLGTSAEDQPTWDDRIEQLGQVPAAVRFVSAEPLLGDIDCGNAFDPAPANSKYRPIGWVIIGGESGPGHRPMDPQWAESIAEQCRNAGVALFVKQDSGSKPGKQGRLSDDLWQFKDFPKVVAA
jgi:protein gp37